VARFREHGNEPLGSVKGRNFLTSWSTISFLVMTASCSYFVLLYEFETLCLNLQVEDRLKVF
jgi:hypothetical protein